MDKYQILKKYFGYSEFRHGQAELIDAILSGEDAVGIMPTGGGKSICFQVPAMIFSGVTVVISPLISLMKDQVNSLRQCGISAAYFNSTLTAAQLERQAQKVLGGQCKMIYAAPERLQSADFVDMCYKIDISMVCVDEAHCVSHWGQDFRPAYLDIRGFVESLRQRPVVCAFTATATKIVREDIVSLLGLHNPYEVVTGFARENLYFEVIKTKDKYMALKRYLDLYSDKSGIVYCATKKAVDEVYRELSSEKFSVTRYHAGLSRDERTINQNEFINNKKKIVIATNAFGMGIDKSNVSFVIHYHMPGDIESYYQEAGRAGRDGSDANCIILFSPQDIRVQKFFIDNPDDKAELTLKEKLQIRKNRLEKLQKMIDYCRSEECLRNCILRYFGENPTEKCGNCSICNGVTETVDVTIQAQKILSCIKRVNESEPSEVISHILKGERTSYIEGKNYDSLSVFGIMNDSAMSQIEKHIDYFIREMYIGKNRDGSLFLEEKSKAVLFKGKRVRKIIEKQKIKPPTSILSQDIMLLRKLNIVRKKLARQKGLPDFVIFTDRTLEIMAVYKPKDERELMKIPGVAQNKAEKYGKYFLDVINKESTFGVVNKEEQ